jgi:hypothetical protein
MAMKNDGDLTTKQMLMLQQANSASQSMSAPSGTTNTGAGAVGGAGQGAMSGAMLGSVVPGLGTGTGAAIGAGVGAMTGILKARAARKQAQRNAQQRAQENISRIETDKGAKQSTVLQGLINSLRSSMLR